MSCPIGLGTEVTPHNTFRIRAGRSILRLMAGASGHFTGEERRSFYLESLGDAHYEGPMLHEPFWWAKTRFPAATHGQCAELAESVLEELLAKGLIELFEIGSNEPLEWDRALKTIRGDTWRTDPPDPIFEFGSTPLGDTEMDHVPKEVWSSLWGQGDSRPKPAVG